MSASIREQVHRLIDDLDSHQLVSVRLYLEDLKIKHKEPLPRPKPKKINPFAPQDASAKKGPWPKRLSVEEFRKARGLDPE